MSCDAVAQKYLNKEIPLLLGMKCGRKNSIFVVHYKLIRTETKRKINSFSDS